MRLTKPSKRGLCRSGVEDRLCLRRFWTLSNLLVPLHFDLAYTWDELCRSPMNLVRIGNELFPNLRLPFLDSSDIPGENSSVPAVPLAPKGACSEDENWSLLDLSADEQCKGVVRSKIQDNLRIFIYTSASLIMRKVCSREERKEYRHMYKVKCAPRVRLRVSSTPIVKQLLPT
jgi:hypothetical protein